MPELPKLIIEKSKTAEPVLQTAIHEWVQDDGSIWATFYRSERGYLARFPDRADFWLSTDGLQVSVTPSPGMPPQTIEHLYLNQVLPLALHQQGQVVFHASAVEIPLGDGLGFGSIVFMGASGRGKSTLAASFATCGYRFLTDDGLLVTKEASGYVVHPSHSSIRLWEDSCKELAPASTKFAPPLDYTPKERLLADNVVLHCPEPRRLLAVYVLDDELVDQIGIASMQGGERILELTRNSFLLDVEDREVMIRHFETLKEFESRTGLYRLSYPRRYELLPALRAALIQHALTGLAKGMPGFSTIEG